VNRSRRPRTVGQPFDVLIVGGGATGLGAAVDAATRGLSTALLEAEDFAKATSSRSTKLVHGGVRYLQNGEIGLVREALHERTNLLENAPHVTRDLPFVLPLYRLREVPYYFAGLKFYDVLAGRSNLPGSRVLSKRETLELVPGLEGRELRAAVSYHDGQFDDARLAISLARTAVDHGAAVANYVRVERFLYAGDQVSGVVATDRESGESFEVRAKAVVNATGIFVDALRAVDDPKLPKLLTHSRGTHIVVPREALGTTTHAVLVPKTSDGRVIFATPWHDSIVIGTTDIETEDTELDPQPTSAEVEYILRTINPYLAKPLAREHVRATFAGLRPLVTRAASTTAGLSREHLIDVTASGLITITGGKWTTYRRMAEDVIDVVVKNAGLAGPASKTARLALHGAGGDLPAHGDPLRVYGSDAAAVRALAAERPELAAPLESRLPYIAAQVSYAARHEMARTVEDVLARRTRALFLDIEAARAGALTVAHLLAAELGRDAAWETEQIRAFENSARLAAPA
jgi:glycerol-3-phosphate dehydrogenase